ncbi:MAG: hypothetical protein A3K23_06505 [Desulfobacca sp. RBG_16_58_9]|nr:MAG: hypothetical protein A3K23_06505 [Desulfobacca sp. RBG_16_58_9]
MRRGILGGLGSARDLTRNDLKNRPIWPGELPYSLTLFPRETGLPLSCPGACSSKTRPPARFIPGNCPSKPVAPNRLKYQLLLVFSSPWRPVSR